VGGTDLCSGGCFAQSAGGQTRLFAFDPQSRESRDQNLSIAAVRQQPIQIDFGAVAAEAKQIEIPLFDGRIVWAVQREREGFTKARRRHLHMERPHPGRKRRRGDVVLNRAQDAMAGSINAPSASIRFCPQTGRRAFPDGNRSQPFPGRTVTTRSP
jgi:hypothetical protein